MKTNTPSVRSDLESIFSKEHDDWFSVDMELAYIAGPMADWAWIQRKGYAAPFLWKAAKNSQSLLNIFRDRTSDPKEADKLNAILEELDYAICLIEGKVRPHPDAPRSCPCDSCRHFPELEFSHSGKRGQRFCKQAERALEKVEGQSVYKVTLDDCDYYKPSPVEKAACSTTIKKLGTIRKRPRSVSTQPRSGKVTKTKR